MRTWDLKAGSPSSFTLAADARLSQTDFANDQIWELSLSGGEPPALALHTTFGLRANAMRLFPRFVEGETVACDPAAFESAPAVRRFYPNFITIAFSPLPGVDAQAEFWAAGSQVVAGRIELHNTGTQPRLIRLEWAALLAPVGEGQRMAVQEMNSARVLAGKSEDLAPVLFLAGGAYPGSGSFPTLCFDMPLAAGETRSQTWALASGPTTEASFEQARQTASSPWDAHRTRIEWLNAAQLEIHTGDADWDAAFALAQNAALGLLISPVGQAPHITFVQTRQPDNGYSLRGDGSDYPHTWSGQTALDAYALAAALLPSSAGLLADVLRNFIHTQAEDGAIEWKPGAGGRRSQMMATPILASLAWKIYQTSRDKQFLEDIYHPLLRFVQAWFLPKNDRDGDGLPEWSHALQTGFDEHPLFTAWLNGAQGADITQAESPALCALLYNECRSLLNIARVLTITEGQAAIEAIAENLHTAVETSWDVERSCYHYWDRETHNTPVGQLLAERRGPGEIVLQRPLQPAARLLVTVEALGDATRSVSVFIHGAGPTGAHVVERLTPDRFRWHMQTGRATTDKVYRELERLEFNGVGAQERVSVQIIDYAALDHTLLLPLWAGIPDAERAAELVERCLTAENGFWQPFGIPACLPGSAALDAIYACVHLPWNVFAAEGLLVYGYRDEAAALLARNMAAIIQNLKQAHAFRKLYHAETGQGIGERNAVQGLAPVSLFLDILGVRPISPRRVEISGNNPFPWPVTVKYRGLTVLKQKTKTSVIFPDGQTIVSEDPTPQVVTLVAK